VPAPLDSLDPTDTAAVNATCCATYVDEWVRAGVRHAVVAPGSRSTPMALALAARDDLAVHVHHDERSAAFVALGIGRASGVPAILLTTSGTAAVELHPAVVEADLSAVPMLVVTADRPPELWDVGAPQTVDQTHLFGRSVRWFAEPGAPDAARSGTWRSVAARSVVEAVDAAAGPGPVHLNLSFREPLAGIPAALPEGRPDGRPWHTLAGHRGVLDRAGTADLVALLDRRRGVIVAGAGGGGVDDVLELAVAAVWPVLADARSGCRIEHPAVVTHADALLRIEALAGDLRPEVVVRLGEPPASKVLGAWLTGSGATQVVVGGDARWFDADRTAAAVVRAEPGGVLRALACTLRHDPDPAWAEAWSAAEAAASAAVDAVLDAHDEATEPAVARTLARTLPADATLVVSSSMPVRDLEWFGGPSTARVLANRGANGIDGVVSTAVGAALTAAGSPTAVLIGDVAFLHDSNALLGLAARGIDLTIVVVDNDGGGIFSFLPQAEVLAAERFELLFGTPHGVDLAALAAAHGIATVTVERRDHLAPAITAAVDAGGVQIVRVRTDRTANVAVHREIEAAVRAATAPPASPASSPASR
jgi:2-succinyl-5-enolpyruvyl-6-hydroxy-3-cyclohexene-1-carboxylate synthase